MCFKVVTNYQWKRHATPLQDSSHFSTNASFRLTYVPCIRCVCLTNFIGHSISNPKCHVTFPKTKMNVNWHLHILLKCHLSVTCLVVRVILISKVPIDVDFFLHKSHFMSNAKLCVLFVNKTCNLFLCTFLRVICQKLIKFCQKDLLLAHS